MSEIISMSSLRNGVGRTTITCLLGLKLAKSGFKTLIIDNNYKFCDVANYLMVGPEYSLDDLKPFLGSGVLDKATIKSMMANAEKNLDILSGSTMSFVNNTLNKEEIIKIKNLIDEDYDYILIDNRAGIDNEDTIAIADIIDHNIIVTRSNKFEKKHYERIIKTLESDKVDKINNLYAKSYVVLNRVLEDVKYDINEKDYPVGKDRLFKIENCDKIINFCNGYECLFNSHNEKEIEKIINSFTNQEVKKNTKMDIGTKLKAIFKVS